MPFPSVTGRVCYHPCEQACNRGQHDEAISIRAVERFLGDLGQALARDVVKAGPPNGKKVAVVGSGPPGTAPRIKLARLGYAVTIFEKSPKAGGSIAAAFPTGCCRRTCSIVRSSVWWRSESRSRRTPKSARMSPGTTLKKDYDACVLAVGLD